MRTHFKQEDTLHLISDFKLTKAHKLLKHLFDGLPFGINKLHLETIGQYSILCHELSKNNELKFLHSYLTDKLSTDNSVQCAFLWGSTWEPQNNEKPPHWLLEKLLLAMHKAPAKSALKTRLALLFLRHAQNTEITPEEMLPILSYCEDNETDLNDAGREIWRALIYRKCGRLEESVSISKQALDLPHSQNWYLNFSLREGIIRSLALLGKNTDALNELKQLSKTYQDLNLEIRDQRLKIIKNFIDIPFEQKVLIAQLDDKILHIEYKKNKLTIDTRVTAGKILWHLLVEGELTRKKLLKLVWRKKYDYVVHEDLITKQILELRKLFSKSNIPKELVQHTETHTHFHGEVNWAQF